MDVSINRSPDPRMEISISLALYCVSEVYMPTECSNYWLDPQVNQVINSIYRYGMALSLVNVLYGSFCSH